MLFRTFPPERRAHATGMVLLGTSLGPAAGPLLGGVLTTYLSWRWCFFVNVPFGTIALIIGLLFLAEHREPAAGRLDMAGFVLAGGGLALFLYALSEAPVRGWTSPVIIAAGVISLAALASLVVLELRLKAPMLNLRLLRNRIFRTTTLISLCQSCGYSGYLFIMPEFLQQARGASLELLPEQGEAYRRGGDRIGECHDGQRSAESTPVGGLRQEQSGGREGRHEQRHHDDLDAEDRSGPVRHGHRHRGR